MLDISSDLDDEFDDSDSDSDGESEVLTPGGRSRRKKGDTLGA